MCECACGGKGKAFIVCSVRCGGHWNAVGESKAGYVPVVLCVGDVRARKNAHMQCAYVHVCPCECVHVCACECMHACVHVSVCVCCVLFLLSSAGAVERAVCGQVNIPTVPELKPKHRKLQYVS
jgi:hypothetical protein